MKLCKYIHLSNPLTLLDNFPRLGFITELCNDNCAVIQMRDFVVSTTFYKHTNKTPLKSIPCTEA